MHISCISIYTVKFFYKNTRCNARGVDLVIDMKEGDTKFQFPLRKGMEHFPRKRNKFPFESIIRSSYSLDVAKASEKT